MRELPGSFANSRNEVQFRIADRDSALKVIEIANREASRLLGVTIQAASSTQPGGRAVGHTRAATAGAPAVHAADREEHVEKLLATERQVFQRNREAANEARTRAAGKCAACGTDVIARYAVDVIEAHHRTAFASLDEGTLINAEELVGLCPSCHRALHREVLLLRDAG